MYVIQLRKQEDIGIRLYNSRINQDDGPCAANVALPHY